MRFLIIFLLAFFAFGLNEAPEDSSMIEKKLEETNKFNQTPAQIENLKVNPQKSQVKLKNITFLLRNVQVIGNTIFPKEVIIKIIKPFVGKKVTNKDLKIIVSKITDLYHKKGYLTSKCILPPQKIKNGTVLFKILEDKLGKVIIVGDKSLDYNKNIFMRYLYDLEGKVINIKELNYRLKLLSTLPVTKITPSLKKTKKGYSLLILKIKPSKQNISLSLDNSGSKYTGIYRLNLSGNVNNIRGISDSLRLNFLTTTNPKYLGAFSGSYITPFSNDGSKLNFGYSTMYYQLNPDKVGTDDVIYEGQSQVLSIFYLKPFYLKKSNLNFKLGIEKKDVVSQTIKNDDGSILVDGEDKTFVGVIGLDSSFVDKKLKTIAINKISLTLKHAFEGMFGSMTKEDIKRKENDDTFPITGPIKYGDYLDPSFTKLYYTLSREQLLPKKISLKLNLNGDYTKKRIPQSYEYGGHDWGFAYSIGFKKAINNYNTLLSFSQSIVYDYNEKGDLSKDTNKIGASFSINKTFNNLYISLSYSSSFATWDNSIDKLRFTLKYTW